MEDPDANLAVRIYDGDTRWETLSKVSGKQFRLLNLHLGLTGWIFEYLQHQPA